MFGHTYGKCIQFLYKNAKKKIFELIKPTINQYWYRYLSESLLVEGMPAFLNADNRDLHHSVHLEIHLKST